MSIFRRVANSGVCRFIPLVFCWLCVRCFFALSFVFVCTQTMADAQSVSPKLSQSAPLDITLAKQSLFDPNTPPDDWVTPSDDSLLVIEAFDYPKFVGRYPEDIWEGRSGWRYAKTDPDKVYYKIVREADNLYLAAETKGEAVNFGREARVNLRLYQKLRWRWRVHSLPEGGNENDSDKNDCAAAIRVIIGTSPLSAKAIKYVWSATLPPATEIDSGRLKVIVVKGGPDKMGQWVWEEVNVYDDYVRLFGGDPRPADAFGLLTDSDNTNSFVKADYDDFIFLIPRPDKIEMVPDFMLKNP